MNFLKLLPVFFYLFLVDDVMSTTIYGQISMDTNLSMLKEIIDQEPDLQYMVDNWPLTLFAPTNDAFEKIMTKNHTKDILIDTMYGHKVNWAMSKEEFPTHIKTFRGLTLHLDYKEVQKCGQPKSTMAYFVNNARILSKLTLHSYYGKEQRLYIIDEVLEPYVSPMNRSMNGSAYDLMGKPLDFGINEELYGHGDKIKLIRNITDEKYPGYHTYFIPISHKQWWNDSDLSDEFSVLAHIIPNKVLFLNMMGDDSYQTLANDNDSYVELSLLNQTLCSDSKHRYSVQSFTVKNKSKKRTNFGTTRILRANIPIEGGVVHLIEKPLMISNFSVKDFIERDDRLTTFNTIIHKSNYWRLIKYLKNGTLLVPTNRAFMNLNMVHYRNDYDDFWGSTTQELMAHVVRDRVLTSEGIIELTDTRIISLDLGTLLFFWSDANGLHVRDRYATATIIEADIHANNGVIHIIDRVLGVSNPNIYDIMRSDPQMSVTFELGQTRGWREQFTWEDRRFTYFVPSNSAWHILRMENPAQYEDIAVKLLHDQIKKVLSAHLVLNQEIFSEDFRQPNTCSIKSYFPLIKAPEICRSDQLFFEWKGMRVNILRPDIQASNGVIHVIDRVLIKNGAVDWAQPKFYALAHGYTIQLLSY